MYLKSLDLHGFKSFANKTKFDFHKGVTGIVGPNGCGKSNVVDAIRWVLGETSAKALRGGEMADVIFNGTDNRKPMGMAEVTLTMGDCEKALKVDYNEVSITRRVFRDGKSEYRINGTLCRLRDIHDLFMDTGIGRTAYSIMEQGKIDMLLSSKPEDRRQVFEEAAGITKFKKEKKEALRKLDYTEANLLRVNDVLAEQERRINSLRRQVAKARRYQSLSADVKLLDTHLGHKSYIEQRAQREELRRSIYSLELKEREVERDLPAREQAVIKARDNAQELEFKLSEIRQLLNEKRNAVSTAQSKIAFNNERHSELENRIDQNKSDIEETKNKLGQQMLDLEFASVSLGELTEKIAVQQAALLVEEDKLAQCQKRRMEQEMQLREVRNELNQKQSSMAAAQAKIESAVAQYEGNRERARSLKEDEERLRMERELAEADKHNAANELADRKSNLEGLAAVLADCEAGYEKIRKELDAERESAAQQHKEFTKTSSRLEVLEQLVTQGEGLEMGTQSVLSGLDNKELYLPGVRGVLAQFIHVESEYSQAVEAVLGDHLQTVLVRDALLAESIIETLSELKMGRAEVVPEDFIAELKGGVAHDKDLLEIAEGAVIWAVDVVKCDDKVARLIEYFLRNVLVVEDLSAAINLREKWPDLIYVTMLGEVVNTSGSIRGGAGISAGEDAANSVLRRQDEIRELKEMSDAQEQAEFLVNKKLAELEYELNESRESLEMARESLQVARVDESSLNGQLSLASREVESLENKISQVVRDRKELAEREVAALDNRGEMEALLADSRGRQDELEMEQISIGRDLEETMTKEKDSATIVNEMRTNLAVDRRSYQSAEEQQRPMAARLDELKIQTERREKEIVKFHQRMEKAGAENADLEEQIGSNTQQVDQLEMELEEMAASRSGLLEAIQLAEKAATETRQQVTKVTEQLGKDEVLATKYELRMESLKDTIRERYQLDIAMFQPDFERLQHCISRQKKSPSEVDEDEVEISNNEGEEEPETEDVELDWGFVESALVGLKRKLDSMGPVNVDAIEEFEELEERHNFVRNQYDDLMNAKEELTDVIERINVETRKRFSETFEKIRKNFQEMFKLLFGEKGQADLSLVDESDPLETGIDVIAKPPGKKLQSITLLSGGERSMTAVALLFSIYQIKPSPFCVLDELDAPLDESNIGRFLKVLDRFIDTSQFIIVTHSKRTMSRADVMYGVTMEEFGVSKPVGMRLTDEKEVDAGAKKSAAQNAALRLDAE